MFFCGVCGVLTVVVLWIRVRVESGGYREPEVIERPIRSAAMFYERYDRATAINRLRRIGKEIQKYRKKVGVKPVGQRRSITDAGLPKDYDWLKVAKSLVGTNTLRSPSAVLSTFPQVPITDYSVLLTDYKLMTNREELWAKRGDRLPIVMDMTMYPVDVVTSAGQARVPLKVLVLRLSGSVEEGEFQFLDYEGFIRRG